MFFWTLQFVHCIVWAKDLLFSKLFGDKNQENDLNVRSNDAGNASEHAEDVFVRTNDEDVQQYGRRIYDHVFGYNIKVALSNEETWKNRNRPRPLYIRDVLPDILAQQNGNVDNDGANDGLPLSAMLSLGLKNPQDVWSLEENSKVFLESLKLFFVNRVKDIGSLSFDKDDQLAVEFVTAAANIRAESFGIAQHSLFEAKGIAGNIVHAVATTNAVIAGLIVIEAIKVLEKNTENYRMTYCVEHETQKKLLVPLEPCEPNKSCCVCSDTPLSLEINTHSSKLRDFVEKIVKAKLGMNFPMILRGSALLYEVGDDLDGNMIAIYAANLEKVLSELPSPVTGGTTLTVEDLQQEFKCRIYIKHREAFDDEKEPDGMVLSGWAETPHPEKVGEKSVGNGGSASSSLSQVQKDDEVQEISEGTDISLKKRKQPELLSDSTLDPSGVANDSSNKKRVHQIDDDDDDDLIMIDHGDHRDTGTNKKKRLQ
uniref:Uncharacterized protein MANES_04G086600 n=1 Tax=Rhizophora mucronata TaxID=61149 RepID=A0A2P2K7G6_RHIMU